MFKLVRSFASHATLSTLSWRMSSSLHTFLVCMLLGLWAAGSLHSQDLPSSAGCSRTFTSDEDFNEGLLLSVNTSVSGSLRLDQPGQPLPFVYIPCSARGTVVRINVVTGEIVGEFSSAPNGRGKDPSRTTVDKFGNVWVSNRAENSISNGVPKGSVIRIGLTIGGTRCNADGTPNASGQYLKPPFIYNTCSDRDGDGLIKTSVGLGNILPWTNAGGIDNDGGVATAEDEAITVYTRVLATGARTIAINGGNEGNFDVWVGGSSNRYHEKLDGETGQPIPGSAFNTGTGGYGGLIDGNGILWSASGPNTPILRYNTADGTYTNISGNGDYGLGIDPNTGEIWATNVDGNRVVKMSPSGAILGSYQHGSFHAQGVGVDAYGNVFVAHSLLGPSTTIGHLKTDGTYVGNIQLGAAGAGPIGIAVDAFGKVWTAAINGNTAQRIDPNAGALGANGEPIGAVDLTVDLGAGAGPYTYSDMTGFVAINATVPSGTWNVIHDGMVAGRKWGKISWTAETPELTGIIVEARASDDLLNLALLNFVPVGNGEEFCCAGVTGRYVEIRTTLFRGITINETPVLYDLTVECCEIYPNEVPTIASSRNCNPSDTLTLPADQPFTMSLFGNDADADQALTISANLLPAGSTLIQDTASTNPVSAVFSWTPTVEQVGVYNIVFQVDDIYCYNDRCPKVLEVIPCSPFAIYGVDPLLTVQCIEDRPAFQDAYAFDECTGFNGDIETWESQTGETEAICEAVTALGPGVDWSVWLPTLSANGDAASAYFNFDAEGGTLEQYTDGTAHLFGTVQNNVNANQKFVVDFWFENKADWTTWDSLGRNYKNDLLLPCAIANHEEWSYYEMKGGFSTLTGAGELTGDVLYMYHTPASYYFGFQIGEGANNKNCNNGMSGWFSYDGFVDGAPVTGHGDINVDTDCENGEQSDCIHNTSFTYFYRSENEEGLAFLVEQEIVIADTTAPVFNNCPENFTMECNEEVPAIAENITATDNCAGDAVIVFLGETIDSTTCTTIITRAWSATDLCGNRADCEQTITIVDTTAPVMNNLPEGEITVECDVVPTAAAVALVDNCDENPTLIYNEERLDGNCANNYTLVRTWYGYDQCQNETAVYTQTIHVQDTTAPEFDAYEFYAHIECDQIPDTIPASDNCGGVNVELIYEIHQSGGCLGVLERRYLATDACGNTTEVEQYIAIMDTTAPVATNAAMDTTIECGSVIPSYNPAFADNCGGELSTEMTSSSVTNDCVTTITELYTATDYCGNSGSVTRVITIVDTTTPVFTAFPTDITISCEENIPAVEMPVASDICDQEVAITYNDILVGGNCPNSYTVVRTFVATDDCGNQTTQAQNIFVLDETAPMFEEQSNEFNYECNTDIPVVTPSAMDNCGSVELSFIDSQMQGNTCETQFLRVWTAADECGNTSEFTQYISIVDTTAPAITGDSEIDRPCDDYAGIYVEASENCNSYSVEYTDELVSGSCAGNIIRHYVAVDSCGNVSNEFTQIIHLIDEVEPTIAFATANFTTECGLPYSVAAASFVDNCDNELEIDSTFTSVTEGCITIETYTWTATDQCGNSSTANTVVTLVDNTNPYFTALPENITVSCETEGVGFGIYSAADNCDSAVEVFVTEQILEGACPQSYTIERTYRAADDCGNQVVETRYVYVIDETEPVFEEQDGSFTYECGEEIAVEEPLAYDNCGEVSLSYTDSEMAGTSCIGLITRTWTAMDECGNSSYFNQYITIVDTQAPVVNAYEIEIEMPCDNVSQVASISATDCNDVTITFTDEVVSGNCAGRIIRTYSVSDACGNTTTGLTQQIINLIDVTAPAVEVAPVDTTIECGEATPSYSPFWSDNCASFEDLSVSNSQEVSEDACSTVITQSWTAVDPCGNSTTVSRSITIVDSTAPVFTFVPENEMLDCNSDDETPVSVAYADDNCSDVTITHSDVIVPGQCPANYTIERTFTATDICGNSASYTQSITVTDNSAPVWNVSQTEFVYECGSGITVETPVAVDNCSLVAVSYTDGNNFEYGCTYAFERVWTAIDACGNVSAPFIQHISFEDTTEPMLSGCPEDLVLACNDNIPAPVEVSAFDSCDDDVQVYFDQTFIGDAPAEGSIADCNLITPVRPANNPCGYPTDWAMVMFAMQANNRYYTVDGGSLVQYPNNTIHLTATMRNTTNPANGWNVDVTFAGNMDWPTWSSQSFPTSYKDDCGGVAENHPSWHYFLMTPGANAELTGFGDFTGSMVNLTHAPSNNYFGFQLGDGANNYNNADNGFGGWFSYSGVFRENQTAPLSNITGSGDFAFELDCCPDYEVVRQWTAVDCSGNISTCMQNISFSASVAGNEGIDGQNANIDDAMADVHSENEMGASPNPTNSHTTFTFKVAKADKTSFEILDMTGKKVADLYSGMADAEEVYSVNYDVRNLAPGVYMFRLINGFDVKIDRLVVGK
jgi:streptogramin lyase